MTKSICKDCKYRVNYKYFWTSFKGDETGEREGYICEKNVDNCLIIVSCDHFNPKPIVSNELKERRIKALQSGKEPRKRRISHDPRKIRGN